MKELHFSAQALRNKGSLHYEGKVPASEFQEALGQDATLQGPLSVTLDLAARGELMSLKGGVSGTWSLECSRCLARPDRGYAAEIEATFEPDQSEIDAAEEIRQALLLALPSRFYCRPDCKGLCPVCRADRNALDCGHAAPGAGIFKPRQGDSHA